MAEVEKTGPEAVADDRFDVKCGVMLAIFASILAVMQLGDSYAEFGMKYAQAEKMNAYAWYNAKSIKQSLVEGQRDTLDSLLAAGVIGNGHADATRAYITRLQGKIAQYDREKDEILRGSAAVGERNWVQELDGKRGQIEGAKPWEAQENAYGNVMSFFDLSNLVLQICMVVGAISLVVRTQVSRQRFYRGAIGLGLTGTVLGIYALIQYLAV